MPRHYRIAAWILLAVALLLAALHLALPYLVERYLNRQMADMGEYRGHVEDVDLEWWRGAYRIEGLRIVKTDGEVPVPFLDIPAIDLAVSWHALLRHGAVVAWITLDRPELNFVDGVAKQTGAEVDWRRQADQLLPILLDEVRVLDGSVHFRNFSSQPPVDVVATSINGSLSNLTNVADAQGRRTARLEITADLLDHAPLETYATFDPLVQLSDFDFRLRVRNLDLTRLNDFARAYGNFDFARGNGDLVIEMHARDGQLDGYIKPLLQNVEVFDWEQDVAEEDKGFLRALWEGLVASVQEVLENQEEDQFGTRVELEGTVGDQEASPWQAFLGILRNAFIEAFQPTFNGVTEEEEKQEEEAG